MNILFYGTLTFFAALAVHLIVWRVRFPRRNRIFILVNIFFWTLVAGIIMLRNFSGYADYIVLYGSLAAAYIVSYPAMEADSPSLAIVSNIAKAGRSGLDKSELYKVMTDETQVVARIDDLLDDGLVRADSDRYTLTSKGLFLANVFGRFRNLLKAPRGG